MQNLPNKLLILAITSFSSNLLIAADDKQTSTPFHISGYADFSYNYLEADNQFTSGVYNRSVDITENGPTVQQLAMTASYLPTNGFGGLVNLILGKDARTLTSYGFKPNLGGQDFGYTIYQLYGQYQHKNINLMSGNFASLAGYESDEPPANKNFSRSFLATFSQPGTHLGVRLNYTISEQLKVILGLNNGWDDICDFNRDPTVEIGLNYSMNDVIAFSMQGYSGQGRVMSRTTLPPIGKRNLLDIILSYHLLKNLEIAANYDYGSQSNVPLSNNANGNASWSGIAGYLNHQLNDDWRYSLRGEAFDDKNGYLTGIEQILKEVTFTIGYSPLKNLELRAETRRDFSNHYSYQNKDSLNLRKTQQSFGLEIVYTFDKVY